MTKSIWLIRHAENGKDEATHLDLTEEGVRKTEILGQRIAQIDPVSPTLIVRAPVLRARRTAFLLRNEFIKVAKNTLISETGLIQSLDPDEIASLINMIMNLDEAPSPQSLVIIGHRRNELLNILHAMLDPESLFLQRPVEEHERLDPRSFEDFAEKGDRELMGQYYEMGEKDANMHNYLDALQFECKFSNWADFGMHSARFVQKLEI